MIDINFFKKSSTLKDKITQNLITQDESHDIIAELDNLRSKIPFIYNI